MANRPTKLIVDCATGERQILELTDEEIAEREARAAEDEARLLAQEQAAAETEAARLSATAKLEAIGLTPEEITALIGA